MLSKPEYRKPNPYRWYVRSTRRSHRHAHLSTPSQPPPPIMAARRSLPYHPSLYLARYNLPLASPVIMPTTMPHLLPTAAKLRAAKM